MSLRRNVAANYVSQIYVTLVGLLILPVYLTLMGDEAFGLIGFFLLVQACFALLDLGLTPTVGRESARSRAGVIDSLTFRRLFRALGCIFAGVAFFGGATLFLYANQIATSWLNITAIPLREVRIAVQVMAISVALRWMGGLYRGVLTGTERLVWLSSFNILFATFRFVLVVPVMWHFGATPVVFFVHQLLVAIVEALVLWWRVRSLLPSLPTDSAPIGWSLAPILPVLNFSLIIAFTTSVWVLVSQLDKIVLSKILSLAEFGFFTLAVTAAGGVMTVSGPISNSIMPRLAKLHAEGRHDDLLRIYRRATQLVVIIAGSAAVTLSYYATEVIYAWTGDQALAKEVGPVMRLYAIGNGFLAVSAFVYYLQYAKGNLRYHFIGNCGLVALLIPMLILAATKYGALGAGYVWMAVNALYFFLWVAYVHHRLEPGIHVKWLAHDVLRIIFGPVVLLSVISLINTEALSRISSLLYVALIGAATLVAATLSSGFRVEVQSIVRCVLVERRIPRG